MALSWFQRWLKKSRPPVRPARRRPLTLGALEDRTVPTFLSATTVPVGTLPRTVTVADFNGDGKADLAVFNAGPSSTGQSSLSVLLGAGDGSFRPAVTTAVPNGIPSVAVGDFNGDGKLDAALPTAGSGVTPAVEVLLGNGDGSFQANRLTLPVGQSPNAVAAGDFDGNGVSDLVTANSNGTLSVLLGTGGGAFRPRTDLTVGGAPRTVAVGDFNGDGRLDVATAQQLTDSVSVLVGRGDGTFAPPRTFAATGAGFTPSSMVVGDVNGDGKLDLAIKGISFLDSDAFQVGVLLGRGDGTFQGPLLSGAQPDGSGDLALGDFNNDGRLDAAVADQLGTQSGNLSVFAGNGDGTFQSLIRLDLLTGGDDPQGVAAADLNGDGRADLVAANTSSGTVGVLLNAPTGVTGVKTSTTLDTSTATAVFGQPVTLTATVTSAAGVPTGTVTFRDGTTVLGTATVDAAGRATLTVALAVGSHELTASFAGAGGFDDSTGIADVAVNPAATSVALTSSVNPAISGQAVTFTATVAAVAPGAGTPTGTVTFRDGGVVLGTVAVGSGGAATFTTSFAVAGGHAITAVYNGDPNFLAGRQLLTEQVNAAATRQATTTTLSPSANPAVVGQAVTFTATVQGPAGSGTPTGTVTFFVGTRAVARVTLDANGRASFTRKFARTGRFTVRAVYSGDANFTASSQSLTEQVIA